MTIDGDDFLVPSDAYCDPDSPTPDPESLVPLVPLNIAECRARLVLFFVDACRDTPNESFGAPPRGKLLPALPHGDFVVVTGCTAGQRCLFGESGSFFTQALAQAMDRRHPARTFEQVLTEVTKQMRRSAGQIEERQQEPEPHHLGADLPGAHITICDGDQLTQTWRRAAEEARLWDRVQDAPLAANLIRGTVLEIVDECARHCGSARNHLSERTTIEDSWSDPNYPVRVLAVLDQLLGPLIPLTAPEVAVLIVAPFLRESVFAEGIRTAAGIQPTMFRRTYQPGPRSDLETTYELYPHVVRRAEGLDKRGDTVSRNSLAMWLVHQWLGARPAIWRSPAAENAYRRGAGLLEHCDVSASSGELPNLMEALIRAVGADPVDHQLADLLRHVYVDDRSRGFASHLWVAGILAADPRRMPTVIADHIGTRLELPLTAITAAVDRMEWRRTGDALDLRMICDNPALYLGIEDVVQRAGTALRSVRQLATSPELRQTIPAQITKRGFRPEQRKDGTPLYETPVARFRLSEDKIRELLMGRQLYNDPSLAIRELYQNALDACRYRAKRWEFLDRTGRNPDPWTGRIKFEQGTDADGREYILCEDNGVGMDVDTLKHVFANAGERFVYRQEYRAEQADWQDLQPPIDAVFNSQFGVGVFSYFMLADEISVVTRPVGRNGIVAPHAYSVSIASSGSLFQITSSDHIPHGGTRVKLYLTGDEKVSVTQTLRALLWIAEYRVDVAEQDLAAEVWEENDLHYRGEDSFRATNDLWWVSETGGLAADGIVTDQDIFGVVANLHGKQKPTFTVDRRALREWDEKWVSEEISRSLPELASWSGLTWNWLWDLATNEPAIAQQVFDHLVKEKKSIPLGGRKYAATRVSVEELGVFPKDLGLVDRRSIVNNAPWSVAWRATRLQLLLNRQLPTASKFAIDNGAAGYPVPDPIDADLLRNLSSHRLSTLFRSTVISIVGREDMPIAAAMKRLRRYAICGLGMERLRDVPPITRMLSATESQLLDACQAWTRPGSPAHPDGIARLAKASAALNISIGDVISAVASVIPQGWVPPAVDVRTVGKHVCTPEDVRLISVDIDGVAPWVDRPLSPQDITARVNALGQPADHILRMCDSLAPLGLAVEDRDKYPADLNELELAALRYVDAVGRRLKSTDLLRVAGAAGISFHEAADGLERLQRCGLLELDDVAALPDLTPPEELVDFISEFNGGGFAVPTDSLHTSDAITLTQMFAMLRSERDQRQSHAVTLSQFVRPPTPLHAFELAILGARSFSSLEEARDLVGQLYPDAEFGELTPAELRLRPTPSQLNAVISNVAPSREGARLTTSPRKIATGAKTLGVSLGSFLDQLHPYRQLGVELIDPTGEERETLAHTFPDDYDVELLTPSGTESAVLTVGPLHLVKGAGRYGWTLATTHARFASLQPLGLILDYPAGACGDETVSWQDLLVVTEYLDGAEPALRGTVTHDHITWAAEELDESVDDVRARLRRFAPLFGFTLPEAHQ
ncbi:hypothetical protein Hesp01_11770 [Herbidospora sp. NBRC 101105]|nr:hypothetical protein Hesp01_11770 [Herbidospora sp. NBRC 101105]